MVILAVLLSSGHHGRVQVLEVFIISIEDSPGGHCSVVDCVHSKLMCAGNALTSELEAGFTSCQLELQKAACSMESCP